MTTMQPGREHHVTSLSTVPPDLNDGTGSGFGRFTGNSVPVNAASECGFGVTFPLTATERVRGTEQQTLYSELTNSEKNILPGTVTSNFGKFLVTVPGEVVGRFASAAVPASPELRQAIKNGHRLMSA
jgi:glutathione peroxidase-family protein